MNLRASPPPDATTRFANRVSDYVKSRPGYPPEVIALLRERAGLGPGTDAADIGAGTGIFTRLLLEAGAQVVHAIEPNEPMRAALVTALGADPRLRAHAGTAESTGLADASVDLIVAAQAFHWFDRDRARREFQRILRPRGRVALVWNARLENASPFLAAYERLLQRRATDYARVNHRNIDRAAIASFFAPGAVERHAFPSEQIFDFDGLRGRLLSSSYAPAAGHPNHAPMVAELREIFDAHQENGRVRFLYETEVYLGRF